MPMATVVHRESMAKLAGSPAVAVCLAVWLQAMAGANRRTLRDRRNLKQKWPGTRQPIIVLGETDGRTLSVPYRTSIIGLVKVRSTTDPVGKPFVMWLADVLMGFDVGLYVVYKGLVSVLCDKSENEHHSRRCWLVPVFPCWRRGR